MSVEHHEHAQGAETDASYGPCCRRTCSALQWYGHFAELLPATVDECLRLSQPESTRVGVSVRQSVAAAWCMAQLQASHPFFATNCVSYSGLCCLEQPKPVSQIDESFDSFIKAHTGVKHESDRRSLVELCSRVNGSALISSLSLHLQHLFERCDTNNVSMFLLVSEISLQNRVETKTDRGQACKQPRQEITTQGQTGGHRTSPELTNLRRRHTLHMCVGAVCMRMDPSQYSRSNPRVVEGS